MALWQSNKDAFAAKGVGVPCTMKAGSFTIERFSDRWPGLMRSWVTNGVIMGLALKDLQPNGRRTTYVA